jgi:hypothetical protein
LANEQNLIPYSERSKEEARENGRKGGVASGVSRRRKRSLKEAADLFLSLPVTDTKTYNKMVLAGVDPDDIDYQMAVVIGMTTKAIKGDAKAAKILIEMLGGTKEEEAQQNTLEKLDEVLDEIGGVI